MAKKVTDKKKAESPKTKGKTDKAKKTVKKKSPATRKKVVEDIPDEEPKGIVSAPENEKPKDIRGRKRAGKPSNAERCRQEARDEKVALICADWLDDIKKARKEIPLAIKIKNLPKYLKLLTREDDVDDESDVTLVLLADKYLGDQKTFHDAEEQSKKEALKVLNETPGSDE